MEHRKSTVDMRRGDSGGPVFYGNKAHGLSSVLAGNRLIGPDGKEYWPDQIYSHLRDIEIQMGVTIYTG
jgi:hypothetical protein